jgi:alpha-tubulin suppressor-like RCC1 family protein
MHTCGVDINGRAKCWGYDGFNQTAVPKKRLDWQEYGVAYSEMRDDEWFMVAAGSFHSCGITKTLQAKCWGQEFAGKTKVPSLHLPDAPNKAPLKISKWEAITTSAGYHHSCGIADGRAICWGDDEYLQTQIPRTAATATSTASQTRAWSSISAGQFHTCGIDALGTAVCWGDDSYGQSHVPDVNRTYEGPWRNVSASHYHSCGVTSIGKMHCWGSTLYGATGFPVEVESWANVAVGRYHSCGVTAQGGMRCWGSNQDGAITVPVEYSASKWRAVTCGLFHTCAITEDRTGVCWGRSVYGLTKVPSAEWASE